MNAKTAHAALPAPGAFAEREFPRVWGWALLAAVFAVACLPFWAATQQGFVDWDDNFNFQIPFNDRNAANLYWHGLAQHNLEWMFTTRYMGHYQPLSWLSFGIEYELWGASPQRMHLVNILIHALNAVLFLRLATRLLAWHRGAPAGREPASAWIGGAVAALFFAVHPLRVESVAWATERRDVLSALFLLGTVLCWLRTRDASAGRALWWAAALACYLLSLLSKAWGMTLPALLVLLEVYPLRRAEPTVRGILRSALSMWPFAPLAAWCGWMAISAQESILAAVSWGEHGLMNRVAQASWGSAFYLWKTLWPTSLSPLYELEEQFDPWARGYAIAMAITLLLSLALLLARKRFPAGLAAWLAFLILASPVLGLVQSGAQKAADRYTYLACLPFAALLGAGFAWLVEKRALRGARDLALGAASLALVAVFLVLGVAASAQTRVWKDSESLWRQVLAVEPDSYIANHNLARAMSDKNQIEEAIALEKRSIELRPGKGNTESRYSLGLLQQRSGQLNPALDTWIEAFKIDPEHAGVITALEGEFARRGERGKLMLLYQELLAKDPRAMGVRLQYVRRLWDAGSEKEAEEVLRAGLAIDPNHQGSLVMLGRLCVVNSRVAEAEPLLERAVRQNPNDSDALADLGAVRAAQNRMPEASLLWEQAARLAPDNPRLRELLQRYPNR